MTLYEIWKLYPDGRKSFVKRFKTFKSAYRFMIRSKESLMLSVVTYA